MSMSEHRSGYAELSPHTHTHTNTHTHTRTHARTHMVKDTHGFTTIPDTPECQIGSF